MAKLDDSAIVMSKDRDAAGRQRLVATITWDDASAGDVAELTVGHLFGVVRFTGMAVYGDDGTMTTRQPDIHAAAAGLSSVPAGARTIYQATSTAKATQIADFDVGANGLPCDLSSDVSLYVRLQPNTGSDNDSVTVLYFVAEA